LIAGIVVATVGTGVGTGVGAGVGGGLAVGVGLGDGDAVGVAVGAGDGTDDGDAAAACEGDSGEREVDGAGVAAGDEHAQTNARASATASRPALMRFTLPTRRPDLRCETPKYYAAVRSVTVD
jgi:hypothetical protein